MKKQMLKSALIALAGVGLMSGVAIADPVMTNLLQQELNARTLGNVSSINVNTDMVDDANDTAWKITANSGSVATLLFEIAGYANGNSFGIYDLNDKTNTLELFAGVDSSLTQVTLKYLGSNNFKSVGDNGTIDTATFSSNNFGYYLKVAATGNIWYSNTLLNTDNQDHMFAYQGENDQFNIFNNGIIADYATWTPNEWILAWEDLAGTPPAADRDFTDFVVMVESVEPIPEPTTMLLFGTGLLGLASISRRKRSN